MPRFIDLTGQVFGRLVVVRQNAHKGAKTAWLCQCSCGKTSVAQSSDLRMGKHRSCGCLQRDVVTDHGETRWGGGRTPEYSVWDAMRQRCTNPNNPVYRHYGGRGITVCERWMHSFRDFLADMGRRPTTKHSIDRIDNDGNYEPGNCRWATQQEQCNNTRRNKKNR
jgi:hypothetical protein